MSLPRPALRGRAVLWLLLLPYLGLLSVPLYNRPEPTLLGLPFFYWYQLAWVPITAFLTYVCYRRVKDDD